MVHPEEGKGHQDKNKTTKEDKKARQTLSWGSAIAIGSNFCADFRNRRQNHVDELQAAHRNAVCQVVVAADDDKLLRRGCIGVPIWSVWVGEELEEKRREDCRKKKTL